jgi:hypothetical protein
MEQKKDLRAALQPPDHAERLRERQLAAGSPQPSLYEVTVEDLARTGSLDLAYVRDVTRYPQPRAFLGVDLGMRRDHSAVAVLELSWIPRGRCGVTYAWRFQPRLAIRALERIPLGTCYRDVHRIVRDYVDELDRRRDRNGHPIGYRQELVVDAGGPGAPVVAELRAAMPSGVRVTPVLLTAGKGENSLSAGYTSVPRRTVITSLIRMIHLRTLRCPPGVDHFPVFMEELLELDGTTTHPVTAAGHDDLVIAVGLGAWAALRVVPELLPGASKTDQNFGFMPFPIF